MDVKDLQQQPSTRVLTVNPVFGERLLCKDSAVAPLRWTPWRRLASTCLGSRLSDGTPKQSRRPQQVHGALCFLLVPGKRQAYSMAQSRMTPYFRKLLEISPCHTKASRELRNAMTIFSKGGAQVPHASHTHIDT